MQRNVLIERDSFSNLDNKIFSFLFWNAIAAFFRWMHEKVECITIFWCLRHKQMKVFLFFFYLNEKRKTYTLICSWWAKLYLYSWSGANYYCHKQTEWGVFSNYYKNWISHSKPFWWGKKWENIQNNHKFFADSVVIIIRWLINQIYYIFLSRFYLIFKWLCMFQKTIII